MKRLGAKSWVEKLPKIKGFKSRQTKPQIVKLKDLDSVLTDGDVVTPKFLKEKRLISKVSTRVKILGTGSISKKLTIKGIKLSESAKQAIVKAGGKVEEEKKKDDSASKDKKSKKPAKK